MKRLYQVLEVEYEALHDKDWDNVLIVVGDEGKGKSHLVLHILEKWVTMKYGKCKEEDIKYINLDLEKWADSFAQCKKGDMNVLDEAGDIAGRRTMSKLNFAISRAYQIIRGDNINSILVLPDLFWLDSFFTKRRARGVIYVHKRGRFSYWNQKKLRRIVAINERKMVKSLWKVKPSFSDTFPKYKGVLAEPYAALKKEYMKETRKELAEAIKGIKGKEGKNVQFNQKEMETYMLYKDVGSAKAAEMLGLSQRSINRTVKIIKDRLEASKQQQSNTTNGLSVG